MIGAARAALDHWGGRGVPRLISHRENAVFAVSLGDGRKAALRLHRPGYNSVPEIMAELWWTNALADRGFPVPRPIPAQNGRLLVELSPQRVATMLDWAAGVPIGAAGQPFANDAPPPVVLYHRLGRLLARLHGESDALDLPVPFQRRVWDQDGLLGEMPLWGRFWEHPELSIQDRRLIGEARQKAAALVAQYRAHGADFGLIHADALRENVFYNANQSAMGGLGLIDFDDSGFGFRLYDLAVAVSQSMTEPDYPTLCESLLDGYGALRPLRRKDRAMFRVFAMLRAFASLGWAMPRLAPDDKATAGYVARARHAAAAFLA